MRAVILAAGRGSRMDDLTADRPKCLVEIEGRTLLDRQVRALTLGGVDEVGIVTGWCAEAFGDTGAVHFHNPRWAETTMVESLATAAAWLDREPVLVSYGDIVYSPATVRRLAAVEGDLAIAFDPEWETLWRSRFARPLDDAETFVLGPAGEVVDIGGVPADVADVQGQYTGLLKFTPGAWSAVCRIRSGDPEVGRLDMTGLLRVLVRTGAATVTTVPVAGPWFEFDHPSDIEVGSAVLRRLDRELGAAAEWPR